MAKYKVGDRIRIKNGPSIDTWPDDMMDWAGEVMTIRDVHGVNLYGTTIYSMEEDNVNGFPRRYWYENMIAGLAEPEREPCTVELRFDGMITTATLKRDGRDVKTAEARCNPKDTYSRAEGARVAVERLFEKKRKEDKPKESKRKQGKPKVGDKFVIVGDFTGHGFPIGEIVTLYHFHKDFSLYMNRYGRKRWVYEVDMKPYKENAK